MAQLEFFDREVDRETDSYRKGLLLGLWDIEQGTYGSHPESYLAWAGLSVPATEGYLDAIDDSDGPRDERSRRLIHAIDPVAFDVRPACGTNEPDAWWNLHIQHVTCPDCQAIHDAARDADELPDTVRP
jgi:hypothetical protein